MKTIFPMLFLVVPSLASMDGQAQEAADDHEGLEVISVTAQKRVQNLQEVPMSVSALSGLSLEKSGVSDITEIDRQMVGVVVDEESASRPYIYIRGIGTRSFDIGSEGSVGVFIDGVYVPRFSSIVSDLLAIERVEVLKGPQGTLYGRNTIGGAISIITKEPEDYFTGSIGLKAGNYDSSGIDLSVNGRASDSLLFSLSGSYSKMDGPIEETTSGKSDGVQNSAIRGRLKFEPTDKLSFDLIVQSINTETDAFVAEFIPNPNRPEGAPLALLAGPQTNDRIENLLSETTEDLFSQALNVLGGIDRDADSITIKAEWDGAPFTVTSISSYQEDDLYERRDFDATRLDLIDQTVEQSSKAISQEIRLTSTPGGSLTFNNKFEWLVGAYFYNDDASRLDVYALGTDTIVSFLATGGTPPFIRSPDLYQVDLETDSFALFSQGTVKLSDRLNLTIGLRYTRDEKSYVYAASTPTPGLPPVVGEFEFDGKVKFTSTDPRVTLDYTVTDDVMLYAGYSQGFKSGGVQYANAVPGLANQLFQPEELKSYDAGMKSRWFDNQLQINASAFFYKYEDQQILNIIDVNGVPTGFTENAGSSELKGFDLEIQAAITEDLTASANYGFLDTEFTRFETIGGADFRGNELPRAPQHTIRLGLSYLADLSDLGYLTLSANLGWNDDYFFDSANTSFAMQESFTTLNTSATWELTDDLFIRAYCSNCTNEVVFTNFTVFSDGSGAVAALDYERQYGLALRKSF